MKKEREYTGEIPGIGSELIPNSKTQSLLFSMALSTGLFCLLPLSEFIRSDEWLIRKVDAPVFTPPPPPLTQMEKIIKTQSGLKVGITHSHMLFSKVY